MFFLFIGSFVIPGNSLAPDVNTSDVGNQPFLNRVFSFLRVEDLFGLGKNTVDYHNNIEEGLMPESRSFFSGIKKPIRNGKVHEEKTANKDEFDSLAIWRSWYRFRE